MMCNFKINSNNVPKSSNVNFLETDIDKENIKNNNIANIVKNEKNNLLNSLNPIKDFHDVINGIDITKNEKTNINNVNEINENNKNSITTAEEFSLLNKIEICINRISNTGIENLKEDECKKMNLNSEEKEILNKKLKNIKYKINEEDNEIKNINLRKGKKFKRCIKDKINNNLTSISNKINFENIELTNNLKKNCDKIDKESNYMEIINLEDIKEKGIIDIREMIRNKNIDIMPEEISDIVFEEGEENGDIIDTSNRNIINNINDKKYNDKKDKKEKIKESKRDIKCNMGRGSEDIIEIKEEKKLYIIDDNKKENKILKDVQKNKNDEIDGKQIRKNESEINKFSETSIHKSGKGKKCEKDIVNKKKITGNAEIKVRRSKRISEYKNNMIKKLESESYKSMVDRKCMNDKININKMMKKTLKMNENDNNEIQRSKRAGKLINDKYDKNQMKDNIFETTKCNKIAVDKYKFNMKDKKGIVKEEINNNNIVNKKSKIGKKCKNKEIDESKENKTIINEKKKTKIIKESNIKEKLINLTKQENKFIGIQTEYKTPLNKQPEKRYRLRCYEPKLIPKIEIEDERLKNSIIQKTLDSKERTNIVKKNRLNHLKDGNTADKIKNIFSNLPLFINKEKNEINNEKIDNEFTISKRKIDDEDNNDGCSNDILEVKNEYKIKDEKENDSCMEDCLYNYISRSRNIKLKSYMNTINMLKDPLKYYPINKLKKGQNYYTCLDTLLSFKKDYLTCGFYSNEYRSGIKRRKITSSDEIKYIDELKRKFKFPSLLYYGEVILNKVKDFEVPIDIYLLTKDPHFKKVKFFINIILYCYNLFFK